MSTVYTTEMHYCGEVVRDALVELLKKPVVRPVVSGVERVVLSDALSGESAYGKVRNVIAGDGMFDAIVEIGVWDKEILPACIVLDLNAAIDAMLSEL